MKKRNNIFQILLSFIDHTRVGLALLSKRQARRCGEDAAGEGVINAELNKNIVPYVTHKRVSSIRDNSYFLQDEGLIPK